MKVLTEIYNQDLHVFKFLIKMFTSNKMVNFIPLATDLILFKGIGLWVTSFAKAW